MSNKIKLLLVDDEEAYVNVLKKRLQKRGLDVVATMSVTEAIQMLRKVDFDIAILDLKMKDMDGIDALRIFKKMYEPMEVIMLTGHGSERAAKEGQELGAFDYLMKPCDINELYNKILSAYKKKTKFDGQK